MASQQFKAGNGIVTISEQTVTLDKAGGMSSESISRAQITSVKVTTAVASFFGLGGAKRITITTSDGRKLVLPVVKPADAKAIAALLR